MSKLFILILLTFSISVQADVQNFFIYGKLPYWESIIISEGDSQVKEKSLSIASAKGWSTSMKSSGAITYALLELSPSFDGGITALIYFGYQSARAKTQKKRIERELEWYIRDISPMLNFELESLNEGRKFLNNFGPIANVAMSDIGTLDEFETEFGYQFTLKEDFGGLYFLGTKGNDQIKLVIEPFEILEDTTE
jgi:hypothetical protein